MSVIHDIGKTERSEMYLKAMLMIAHENPPVTVTKVAEFLGVSPASVSEMVRRMESNDLVTNSSSGITFTPAGLKDARRLVRRMRLAERLLSDVLGCRCRTCTRRRAAWSTSSATRWKSASRRCWAIRRRVPTAIRSRPPPGASIVRWRNRWRTWRRVQRRKSSACPSGIRNCSATCSNAVSDPGVEVTVDEVAPFNGPLFLVLDDQRHAVAREALEQVRVLPLN